MEFVLWRSVGRAWEFAYFCCSLMCVTLTFMDVGDFAWAIFPLCSSVVLLHPQGDWGIYYRENAKFACLRFCEYDWLLKYNCS
jgi:hypothetical protein